MGTRGRTSAAASLTVIGSGGIESTPRPVPPDELDEEQAAEWQAIVNRMPADWFGRETIPLLAQYVRHIVRSKRIAEMIKRLEDQKDTASFDTKSYLKLLRAEDLQSRVLTTLATKMRISQQSTYDKSKKKPSVTGAKLWSKDY